MLKRIRIPTGLGSANEYLRIITMNDIKTLIPQETRKATTLKSIS